MGFTDRVSATYATLKVDQDTNVPFFGIKEKTDAGWGFKSKHNKFSGYLRDVTLGSYQYKDAPVDTVEFKFEDGTETILLEMNLDNGLCRSILNSLVGEESFGEIVLEVYKNKAGYPSVMVKNSKSAREGNKTDWKYKFEEFPVKVKNKKGVVTDDTDYLDFMKKMATELKERLHSTPVAQAERVVSEDMPPEDGSSALPF